MSFCNYVFKEFLILFSKKKGEKEALLRTCDPSTHLKISLPHHWLIIYLKEVFMRKKNILTAFSISHKSGFKNSLK